jgi:hypothetical protein
MSQIKKARGQNKWINNPKPKVAPRKEDFCYVIPKARLALSDAPPCRPEPLNQIGWELAHYHAARLEHVPDTYRLYHYGSNARGTFRGDVLVCESIPESARKRDTPEKGEIVLDPNRGKAISAELETYERDVVPTDVSPKTTCDLLDATLRRWIGVVS